MILIFDIESLKRLDNDLVADTLRKTRNIIVMILKFVFKNYGTFYSVKSICQCSLEDKLRNRGTVSN